MHTNFHNIILFTGKLFPSPSPTMTIAMTECLKYRRGLKIDDTCLAWIVQPSLLYRRKLWTSIVEENDVLTWWHWKWDYLLKDSRSYQHEWNSTKSIHVPAISRKKLSVPQCLSPEIYLSVSMKHYIEGRVNKIEFSIYGSSHPPPHDS